jgi:hypothetical protein
MPTAFHAGYCLACEEIEHRLRTEQWGIDGVPVPLFGTSAPAAEAQEPTDKLEAMRARKDAAYEERNKVVAALARLFPSGVARTAIEGWSDDWHGCVYIDLPTGQVSWHFHDSQAHLFNGLPSYTKGWDGHDTPEKYRRLAALAAAERPVMLTEALDIALDALDEIALAGMSYGEPGVEQEVIDRFHAGRAWAFIGMAARAKERARAAKNGAAVAPKENNNG